MSSITSTSGSSSADQLAALRQKMFTNLDTNNDGSVSEAEFVAGRPSNVSESQASALYQKIDTNGTGALTQTQLSEGLEKNRPHGGHHHGSGSTGAAPTEASLGSNLSDSTMSQLLSLLGSIATTLGASSGSGSTTASGNSNASTLFSQLDTDGDGSVSQAEFVAGRPSNVSAADATSLFNSIDTAGTGSITEAQFAQSLPPAPGQSATGDSSTGTDSNSSTLLTQLMSAINTYASNYSTTSAAASNATSTVLATA